MDFTYYPIFAAFYNSFGSPPATNTGSVIYNGTPKTGGTPPNPSYSLVANESVSQALLDIWNEFVLAYTAIATNTTNISSNGTSIMALLLALQNLKTGATTGNAAILYNGTPKTGGTPPNPTYSMTTNEAINSIFIDIWNEFTAVYTTITGISSGVSQTVLNNTMKNVVTDFTTGLGYTSATGLVVTIASGSASIGGQYVTYGGGTIIVTATKDNWIYLKNDGTLQYIAVNVSDPQPATPSGQIVLWKVTTGSSGVTSHNDKRNTFPFTFSQIADFTLAIGQAISGGTSGEVLYVDAGNTVQNATIATVLGYTPESTSNKATSFSILNNTLYATTQAIATYVAAQIASSIASKQNIAQSITVVNTTPYLVLNTDAVLNVDVTIAPITIQLPVPNTVTGQTFNIFCGAGDISVHNITVTAIGGANVKGVASYVMNTANNGLQVISNSTVYFGILG